MSDIIITGLRMLLGFFAMVFLTLIIADIDRCLPAIAIWLVRRHTARLPLGLRERMEEEWLAEVDASPSHVQRLLFALGLFTGTADPLRAHGEQKPPRIHGGVNVRLTGVSTVASVGTVGAVLTAVPAHVVITVPPATLSITETVAASIVETIQTEKPGDGREGIFSRFPDR